MRNLLNRSGTGARLAVYLLVALMVLAGGRPGPAAAQDDERIAGTFTVSIGRDDLQPGIPGQAALLGLWTITFDADGAYAVARQDVGTIVNGSYETDGDLVTFNDWQGLLGCGGPTASDPSATYRWDRDGETLRLTVVEDGCSDRRVLLTTRAFGSFQACTTPPLPGFSGGASIPGPAAATPVASSAGVGAQEGRPADAEAQAAIDALLREATGCWATGEPGRFLALHTDEALSGLAAFGPMVDFAQQLRLFMTTPIEFRRIGDITMTDPDHAWAYVEITLGGDALPQRLEFAYEDGTWLFDMFFLLGTETTAPTTSPGAP